jgi:PhnB protein
MKVSPFLFFDGSCRSAMEFYQNCLGGDLLLSPVSATPMAVAFPAHMQHRIINARLSSAHIDISACDWMLPHEVCTRGNMNCMYVSEASRADTQKIFDLLARNAQITDPLKDQPFGLYGALNDQFGVRWMFHAS